MIAGLYFATFIVSLTVVVALLLKHKRTITVAILFSILVTVNSFGRFLIAVAYDQETAVLGNLMVYIGGCFIPLVAIKILAFIGKEKMPGWLMKFLTVSSCVILALVLTVGHFGIYYKSCRLVLENNCHYLEKEYGPTHFLFPLLMILYCVVISGQLAVAFRKRKEISMRTVVFIVIQAVAVIICYIIQKLTKTHISYLSIVYLVAMLFFMKLIDRINMYDLPTNIANSIEELKGTGYVEFDSRYRLAGYNQQIQEMFPEVEDKWKIDEKIQPDSSFLYREVICWVYNRKPNEKKTIPVGDRYYEMYVREIPYNNKPCIGYMLEMIDRTSDMKYMTAMRNYNEDLQKEVKKKTENIAHIRDTMVVGMASMVESRDDSTGDHIKRTYAVMRIFSQHLKDHLEELGFTEEFLEMVTRAAPMHDLGKIAVDDCILRKKGRLTPEEYEVMKKHPGEGAKIVRNILTGSEDEKFVKIAVNVAHYHHERWDGNGYPEGLKGEIIPPEARLMALADAFDAMVSKRCYKEAFSFDNAFDIIENSLGTQFDPTLGKLFLECRPDLIKGYQKWTEEEGDTKSLQLSPTFTQ